MAAANAELGLQVGRRQQFRRADRLADTRRKDLQAFEADGLERIAACFPTLLQIVGRVLNQGGKHMFSIRRQGLVVNRGDRDFHDRRR